MGRWTDELRELQAMIPEVSGALTSRTAPEAVAVVRFPSLEATQQPISPIRPEWLVVYRDHRWNLCGGCDDRQHGTVQKCQWGGGSWTVHLTDGQRLPLASIRSVGKTDGEGKLIAAWSVREHGFDGMRGNLSPVVGEAISEERSCDE